MKLSRTYGQPWDKQITIRNSEMLGNKLAAMQTQFPNVRDMVMAKPTIKGEYTTLTFTGTELKKRSKKEREV